MSKIIAISDTHNRHNKLVIPECDILIHAGDATGQGTASEIRNFAKWFNKQPAKHKVFVPGNHELYFEKSLSESKNWFFEECPNGHLLIHEKIEIEGLKIFGSPYTPEFYNWAFNVPRGPELRRLWNQIPDDTNILITHGMPYGILDVVYYQDGVTPRDRVGCFDLMSRILELRELKLYVGGHLHGSSGETYFNGVKYINASVCDEMYMPSNEVRVVEL